MSGENNVEGKFEINSNSWLAPLSAECTCWPGSAVATKEEPKVGNMYTNGHCSIDPALCCMGRHFATSKQDGRGPSLCVPLLICTVHTTKV